LVWMNEKSYGDRMDSFMMQLEPTRRLAMLFASWMLANECCRVKSFTPLTLHAKLKFASVHVSVEIFC
jgi:hypothetical protein